jgi:hypothetical protein
MSEWQTMETAPVKDMPVIVYFSKRKFYRSNGKAVSFGEVRDYAEMVELGYYEKGEWSFAGTGHDMFESWRTPDQLPTHWMPLPPAPATQAA